MSPPTQRLTFLDAALEVLRTEGRAMTAEEIADEIRRRRLVATVGKTPVATLQAALYTHVRDHPRPMVRRVAKDGPQRAIRGSVHWTLAVTRAST